MADKRTVADTNQDWKDTPLDKNAQGGFELESEDFNDGSDSFDDRDDASSLAASKLLGS